MSAAAAAVYPGAPSPLAGDYTATWNGTGTLVNSLTSGGQAVATHAGVILASLASPPAGVAGTADNPAGTATYAAVPC